MFCGEVSPARYQKAAGVMDTGRQENSEADLAVINASVNLDQPTEIVSVIAAFFTPPCQ